MVVLSRRSEIVCSTYYGKLVRRRSVDWEFFCTIDLRVIERLYLLYNTKSVVLSWIRHRHTNYKKLLSTIKHVPSFFFVSHSSFCQPSGTKDPGSINYILLLLLLLLALSLKKIKKQHR